MRSPRQLLPRLCCRRDPPCPRPPAAAGVVSAETQGRGDALGQGLLGFTDHPSPWHWILVHSDAVSFPCQGEFAQSAVKTAVVPGTAPARVARQQHG